MKRVLLWLSLTALLLAACQTGEGTSPAPAANPCGDGVCDAAERANPNLCPQDCAAATAAPSLPSAAAETTGSGPGEGNAPPPSGEAVQSGDAMYHDRSAEDPYPAETYLAQVQTTTGADSAWEYETTLIANAPVGQPYDVGAFCRLFQRPDGDGYEVLFGGAFNQRTTASARYEGNVHRWLGADLTFREPPTLFSSQGGDPAVDFDGQFYYLLTPHPDGWRLTKYDAAFNQVAETLVALPPGHAANDEMLRVWGDRVYLSGLYNPNYANAQPGQTASADEKLYTHLWVYDTALNPLEDHVLDEAPNINGGTLLRYRDGFAYIAADNFVTNRLYAHLYDADWHYQRSLLLSENGQWAMGATMADDLLYIAWHRGEHSAGDVLVDIRDLDWDLVERLQVTAVEPGFNAQRPWVQVFGDRMFVSYDLESNNRMDLQCMITVYRRR